MPERAARLSGMTGMTGLTFGGVENASLEELGNLLVDLDRLYWECVETWDEDAVDRSNPRPRIERLHLGSPLEILLALPDVAWIAGFGFTFAGALSMIFKLPARFQAERWQFWQTRLAADRARREWVESKEAEYADSPITLEELTLPAEAERVLDETEDS